LLCWRGTMMLAGPGLVPVFRTFACHAHHDAGFKVRPAF
jgi:hypothetical protein